MRAWAFSCADPPADAAELDALLSDAERQRAARFRHEADRRRSVVTRGMLRRVLGEELGVPEASLELSADPRGKPRLAGASGDALDFNVSHSGEWALIAVSRAGPVGADIERVRPVSDLDRLIERVATPAERTWLRSLGPEERLAGFFRFWTRKEACAKALGTGVATGLNRIDTGFEECGAATPAAAPSPSPADNPADAVRATAAPRDRGAAALPPEDAGLWSIWSAEIVPDYFGAVAARTERIDVRRWSGGAGWVPVGGEIVRGRLRT